MKGTNVGRKEGLTSLLESYVDFKVQRDESYSHDRKPRGYWNDWNNVKRELPSLVDRLGGWPDKNEFSDLGLTGLRAAIYRHHGGPKAVRKKLGLQVELRKPMDYWKNLDNVIYEANKVLKKHKLKTLPGSSRLLELGYPSISNSIYNYHGGIANFRKLLGQEKIVTQRGLWRKKSYVLDEVKKIMREEGWDSLPSSEELKSKGYSSLDNAIYRYHGGMSQFRKLIGDKQLKLPNKSWEDEKFVMRYARKLMKDSNLEDLPSNLELGKMGHNSFVNAVSKYHGGVNWLRTKLGLNIIQRDRGCWKNTDYAISQAKEIMKKEGWNKLPSSNVLSEKGYDAFVVGVGRHQGGIIKFRQLIGEEIIKLKNGTWKDETFVLNYARDIMNTYGVDYLPPSQILNKAGYGTFTQSIQKYHGGMKKFRELIHDKLGVKNEDEQLEELLTKYASR